MALVTLRGIRTPAHLGQPIECEHWELQRGQKWLVLGANGGGKTLFARVLLGKQALARGERSYDDTWTAADVGMVSFERQFELHALDDRFDDSELREDANDPGTLVHDFLGRDAVDSESYQYWLNLLGLETLESSGIRGLSTGQMRKLLLAKAVLSGASILILDDPLAGLDKVVQSQFEAILNEVFQQIETVLLLTTRHSQVPAGTTHAMVLAEGKVAFQGGINDLPSSEVEKLSASGKAAMREQRWPDPLPQNIPREQPLIEMRDVSVSFDDAPVFCDLTWTLDHGQHALISGPNGCGKSTLLNMLTGENAKGYGQHLRLFGITKGSGESIWQLRSYFGVVSASIQRQYAKGASVLDVVLSGFQDSIGLYSVSNDNDRDLAKQWLEIVGARDLLDRRYHQLSFGQQKLVLVARAMVKQPAILILDEPCIGLDEPNRARVLEVIDKIAANSQTHILFVSHVNDERPSCINQLLQFQWCEDRDCYRIDVTELAD